jgi:hypothetical protein
MNRALGWSSYRLTPDYFNGCDNNQVGVPLNIAGYQNARTGNAYAGFATAHWSSSDYREIIGIQLLTPLIIGQNYYVSFYVSRAENTNTATNKTGAAFSTVPYTFSNAIPIINIAHIYSDSIIADTTNWVQISGSFIADSAYQYVAFGNFFTDSAITYNQFDSSLTVAYYYIDDVCVSTDSLTCNGFHEGQSESTNHHSEISIYPNPTTSTITLNSPTSYINTPFSIYNSLGEKIFTSYIKSTHQTIELPAAAGVYFLKVDGEGAFVRKVMVY